MGKDRGMGGLTSILGIRDSDTSPSKVIIEEEGVPVEGQSV